MPNVQEECSLTNILDVCGFWRRDFELLLEDRRREVDSLREQLEELRAQVCLAGYYRIYSSRAVS